MKTLKYYRFRLLVFSLCAVLIALCYQPVVSVFCGLSSGDKVAIIMYHNISDKPSLLGKFAISSKQFEKDLIYIKEKGYNTITLTQLIDYVYKDGELPEKPVILTFDDGYESFYAYAYPLLKKYDMCAVMSIVGEFTDLYTNKEDHNLDYSHLNWSEVKEMSQSGNVEIQNHTYGMHRICNGRKGCGKKCREAIESYRKVLEEDVGKLQKEILDYTGSAPNTFTYPYGYICPESMDFIKELGFQAILTCTEHLNTIEYGSDWLYDLGRYNRPHGKSSEEFFKKILTY